MHLFTGQRDGPRLVPRLDTFTLHLSCSCEAIYGQAQKKILQSRAFARQYKRALQLSTEIKCETKFAMQQGKGMHACRLCMSIRLGLALLEKLVIPNPV